MTAPVVLHLGCGRDIREGCINKDPILDGWKFEDGLPEFADGSVDAITISHALQNVAPRDLKAVIWEFARVLRVGGVLRITDDETEDPKSPRYGKPWVGPHGSVHPTGRVTMGMAIVAAGLRLHHQPFGGTEFLEAPHLVLIYHREKNWGMSGDGRYVFYLEGVKV